jgi:hypothetical protein
LVFPSYRSPIAVVAQKDEVQPIFLILWHQSRLDIDKTAVQFTVNGIQEPPLPKAQDSTICEDHEAWYYDNPAAPTRVLACPAMCTRVQAASEAEVNVLFDCVPPVILK